jgi:hypothetical protein
MVTTGARARSLQQALASTGLEPAEGSIPGPRLHGLRADLAAEIVRLYSELGGTRSHPQLRPGAWDLAFGGNLVVELDEELHFNRYRSLTLQREWTAALPWRNDYLRYADVHEPACLAAARWGRRWTNPSCEAMFGSGDPPGTFSTGGAPRWKQRALYDAMKDAAALSATSPRVVRLATVDIVGTASLGDGLSGRATIDCEALRELVEQRMTQ